MATKYYFFSFQKHGHDIEFRANAIRNAMYDMEDGVEPMNGRVYDRLEKELDQLNEIMEWWDGRPASKIPGYLYGIAMEAVNWASNRRAATCIEKGRTDLLQYC